jgi:hypothetical protein
MSFPNSSQPQGADDPDGHNGRDGATPPDQPPVEFHDNPIYGRQVIGFRLHEGNEIDSIELSPTPSQAETAELSGRTPAPQPQPDQAAVPPPNTANADAIAETLGARLVNLLLSQPATDGSPTGPNTSTGCTPGATGSQKTTSNVLQVLKDLKSAGQSLSTYSGDIRTLAVIINFFLALAGFFHLNLGEDEADWVPFFPRTLTGKAQAWYQHLVKAGTSPTTWQEYRTTLCAHYLGTDWVTRVQHVLDTPQGWGQQQPNESIIAYHQRWKEVHDLYALGAASRIPPRVEIGFFISHLLPWYQELVDRRNTFLCMAPGAASGASTDTEDTEDIDSLVRFLTKAESNPRLSKGHPTPSLNHIHGHQQAHYTGKPQNTSKGHQRGFFNHKGSNAPRRQTRHFQPPNGRKPPQPRQGGQSYSQTQHLCYRCLKMGVERAYDLCRGNQCPTAHKFCGYCGGRQTQGRCTNADCPASRSGTQAN